MSKVAYKWNKGTPPAPDVYVTRRGTSTTYLTNRYWDGERWYEIAYGPSRGGTEFKWPKKSRVKEPRPKGGFSHDRWEWHLRTIHKNADLIQWGEAYTVYDEKEVLAYLVQTGVLAANWREAYQEDMRLAGFKLGRGRT